MEKNCPCCDKHCPVEKLSCGEGRRHFGMENAQREGAPEERMIVLLRKCGHFLHHSLGPGADVAPLTEALSAEERATLESLLEKCLNHWASLPQAEGPAHGEGRPAHGEGRPAHGEGRPAHGEGRHPHGEGRHPHHR